MREGGVVESIEPQTRRRHRYQTPLPSVASGSSLARRGEHDGLAGGIFGGGLGECVTAALTISHGGHVNPIFTVRFHGVGQGSRGGFEDDGLVDAGM